MPRKSDCRTLCQLIVNSEHIGVIVSITAAADARGGEITSAATTFFFSKQQQQSYREMSSKQRVQGSQGESAYP